jgi:pimeloyl-ACP methyl ester carboxylesterase
MLRFLSPLALGLCAGALSSSLWARREPADPSPPSISSAADARPMSTPEDAIVHHRRLRLGELGIFYREAGPRDAPVLLLLHGFPSSSFMFRQLLPSLADRYHVIAPDYPGFGESSFPGRDRFRYTFEQLARVLDEFTAALGLRRYALYIQDYGAPVGLRLALAHPERVSALIVQNGNAYEQGFNPDAWQPLRDYWRDPSPANRERLRGWLTPEGVRQQYVAGLREDELERFSPDTWTLDWARLSRPGNAEAQLDLFGDYAQNVDLYPAFHDFFRRYAPPTLVLWGRQDPFFTPAGAEAYRTDLPEAELVWLDAGHFALETHAAEIATSIRDFLQRRLGKAP